MDLTALFSSFSTGTYTVTRRGAAQVVRGRFDESSVVTSTLTISASISPAGGRDLQRLPEGRYDRETRVVFTLTQLYVGGQDAATQADRLTLEGVDWEVQHVETWQLWGSAQKGFKCLIQRP